MNALVRALLGVPVRLRARLSRPGGDRGSAVVEAIVLGVLLTLPVFYLVVTLARLQAGAFAATAAAREAGRSFVTAPGPGIAPARAVSAAGLAYADHGFDGEGAVDIGCGGSACLEPGSRIEVLASLPVPLPLVPDFMAGVVPTSITVTAHHVETVDEFRAP